MIDPQLMELACLVEDITAHPCTTTAAQILLQNEIVSVGLQLGTGHYAIWAARFA